MLFKNYIFQGMGMDILCGSLKGTLEIPYKISDLYIER